MRNSRLLLLLGVTLCLLVGASAIAPGQTMPAQVSGDEQKVWNLEHDYWRYVQDNNLTAYLGLWNKDFLGWPAVSAAPVGKEHITDWVTSQTAKGLTFKTVAFKPAKIQMTGDVAVACYWVTFQWLDKAGQGDAHTMRITHTWRKDGNDWRIIGGMSMPEPASPQK